MTTDKSGRTSAGILLWRRRDDRLEVLLAHMGGPYWVDKDLGHRTIPKGEIEQGEEPVAVARREFAEETGSVSPIPPWSPARSGRSRGSSSWPGRPGETWTPRPRSATPTRPSGRPGRGGSRPSPRSTGSNGSASGVAS